MNKIINYRKEKKELINFAIELSKNKIIISKSSVINNDINDTHPLLNFFPTEEDDTYKLSALQHIVAGISHEDNSPEFELVFEIPANKEVSIELPIKETMPKDKLGYYVIWDNGRITHNVNKHIYLARDDCKEYHVKFFGLGIEKFGNDFLFNNGYKKYLTKVISFGRLGHTFISLKNAFYECINNFTVPQTLPRSITNTSGMFHNCIKFNQPLNDWNVSLITDMSNMFNGCIEFNQPLNIWNVSNVTNMWGMFKGCKKFNQPLNDWMVINVRNMCWMFYNCTNFNQPLNNWDLLRTKASYMIMFSNISEKNEPQRWGNAECNIM